MNKFILFCVRFALSLPPKNDMWELKVQHHSQRVQIEDQIFSLRIWNIWITFATTWFIFIKQILSLSQTHLFGQIQRYSKSKIDQVPKTFPFSHNQNSPHKRLNFANKRILDKIQISTLLFLKFTSGWLIHLLWPLSFSPFGIKHQNGIAFGPLTPLPHQNVKQKRNDNENTIRNLGQDTFYRSAVEALSLSKFTFPFQCSLETTSSVLKQTCQSQRSQVVAHLPLNMCVICIGTSEVRG